MFILRVTEMPTLQKLLELERVVAVDGAGVNQPVGPGTVRACIVGECIQGPFTPTIVTTPGDIKAYFVGDETKIALLSQSGVDPASAVQNGSGVTFDGNLWAELKGKTFSGLVIQRVDCDMVVADSSVVKAYVKFDITVNAADITAGVTNKDIIVPAGMRFGDNTLALSTVIIATSQAIRIPAGTTCGGTLAIAMSFTQDAASGVLTWTAATGAPSGATCFFVKGTTLAIAGIDTLIDTVLPGVNAGTVISGTPSTINASAAATAIFAPANGGAQGAMGLSDLITTNYAPAISKTLPGVAATDGIVAIWSARNYQMKEANAAKNLRLALWNNAKAASLTGRGRAACVTTAPALGDSSTQATTAKAVYTGLIAADGITGADADRFWASGPYVRVFSAELNADIMISSCGFRACMKVNLANLGKSEYQTSVGDPENASIQNIDAQESCFATNPLQEADFIAMRAAGIAWLVRDRESGWWFYSGVTGANQITYANRVSDNRRSFADEIQDMIFGLATKYAKKPGTPARNDAFADELKIYTEHLVNPGIGDSRAKASQVVDGAAAGNTDYLNGHGVFLTQLIVQMHGDENAIVINTQVGPNVVISQA